VFWHRLKKIDSLLKPITRHALKSHHYLIAQIYMHWKDIVGTHFYKISKPEKVYLKNPNTPGILYLKVAHSAYIMEIRFHEKMIIEKVNGFLGQKAIEKINYVHHQSPPPQKLTLLQKQHTEKNVCPLHLEQSLQHVKDQDLLKALFSLGNSIIEDKKKNRTWEK
jgi:hypothetical protein